MFSCVTTNCYEINIEHLNHNTYTDIITFDLSEGESNGIEGEIYISTDRVKENSVLHKSNETHELIRVISHGLVTFTRIQRQKTR
jgi:probable rRNA maturation factor